MAGSEPNPFAAGAFAAADTAMELLARIEFPAETLPRPLLGTAATWIGRIAPALARAGLSPADHGPAFLRITAIYERAVDGAGPPDATESDYDPRLIDDLRGALGESGWNAVISDIEVREEWHTARPPGLLVALYTRR